MYLPSNVNRPVSSYGRRRAACAVVASAMLVGSGSFVAPVFAKSGEGVIVQRNKGGTVAIMSHSLGAGWPGGGPGADSEESCDPIGLYFGEKRERAIDLRVAISGPDLEFGRSYSSRPGVSVPLHAGHGWRFNFLPQINWTEYAQSITLIDDPTDLHTFALATPDTPFPDARWRLPGASDEYFRRQFISLRSGYQLNTNFSTGIEGSANESAVPTFAHYVPGVGETHFFKYTSVNWDPDSTLPFDCAGNVMDRGSVVPNLGLFVGRVAQIRDVYGNRRDYRWEPLEILPTGINCAGLAEAVAVGGSCRLVRPTRIFCYSAEGVLEAEIVLNWNMDRTSVNLGRLRSMSVRRPFSVGAMKSILETQRVEYLYVGDDLPDLRVPAGDLGSDGDLIQVITMKRVSGTDPLVSTDPDLETFAEVEVTQYRYHQTGVDCLECARFPSGLVAGQGVDHQLKAIYGSEEIEYYANAVGTASSSVASIVSSAFDLLTLDADDVAFTDPMTTGNVTVAQMASKVIGYETGTGEEAVAEELTGSGCGCGGGESQRHLKIERFVRSDGVTTLITEAIVDPVTGLFQDYRINAKEQAFYGKAVNPEDNGQPPEPTEPVPYLIADVVIDASDSTSLLGQWITQHVHEDAADGVFNVGEDRPVVKRVNHPSSFSGATGAFVPGDAFNPPSFPSASASAGRVTEFTYTNTFRQESIKQLELSSDSVEQTLFFAPGDPNGLPHLPFETRRWRVAGSTDGGDIERVRYSYGFHPNLNFDRSETSDAIAWRRIERELEAETENGPGGWSSTFELYNRNGELLGTINADGARAIFEYFDGDADGSPFCQTLYPAAPATGAMRSVVQNSAWSGSGVSAALSDLVDSLGNAADNIDDVLTAAGLIADRNSDGGSLRTDYLFDRMGRQVQAISPGGITSTVARSKDVEPFTRPGVLSVRVSNLPHGWGSGSSAAWNGPMRSSWRTNAGAALRTSEFSLSTSGTYNPLDDQTYMVGAETARTVDRRRLGGALEQRERWSNLSLTTADIVSRYRYDGMGRTTLRIDPNNNAERSHYNVQGRLTQIESGTWEGEPLDSLAGSGGNLITTKSFIYDEAFTGSNWVRATGEGRLTTEIVHPTASSAMDRMTHYVYDPSGRRAAVISPRSPHAVFEYDDLGRVVRSASIGGAGASVRDAAADGVDEFFVNANADRHRLTRTSYGQRGLTYRSEIAIEPAADPADSQFAWLETNRWFDAKGRVIAEWGPNGPGVKTAYDGLDRPIAMHYSDRGGDAAPGEVDSFDDASTLLGDIVLEQVEYAYVTDADGVGPHVGQRALATSRQRLHDSSSTGALAGANSIASFTGYGYDGADRPMLQINFGTNGVGFESGTMAPNGSGVGGTFVLADAEADSVYSRTEYDDEGHVVAAISSGNGLTGQSETRTAFFYDDAHRRIGVIENHDETAAIVRDTSGSPVQWGWILSNAGSAADENRATIFGYDPAGNMTHLVAARHDLVGGTEYQVTRYTYEARTTDDDLEGPVNDVTNLINSNSALTKVEYPMAVDGDDATDVVHYRVNALGETIAMQDQNGTVHEYELDELGRLVNDRVAAGSGVYATIDRLWMDYDDAGRFAEAKSYGATSVFNAVKFEYTGLGQVWKVIQNPVGDIGTLSVDGTAEVEYDYANAGVDRGSSPAPSNYSRRTDLLYPSAPSGGRTNAQLEYAAGLDSAISRPSAVNTVRGSSSHRVGYDYIGMSMLAVKEHEAIDHRLDRFKNPLDGVETSGEYPGYDHLGRVAGQLWVWTDGNGDWDAQGDPALPGVVRPALADLRYSYDTASNVLNRLDRRASHHADPHGTAMTGVDERYRYDGLNRLLGADRGRFDGNGTWSFSTTDPRGQEWSLDLLGNWSQSVTNTAILGGDQNNFDAEDTVDDRRHNAANEILDPTTPLSVWGRQITINSGTPAQYRYEYDNNGNMTARVEIATGDKWGYGYDAWNRLVRVYVQPNSTENPAGAINDRVYYRYNPLHWRVRRTGMDPFDPSTLEVDSRYYYDADWRLLEDRTDNVDELIAGGGPGGIELPPEPSAWEIEEITQWVWGVEYIDELLSFMRDTQNESAQAPPDGRFDDAAVKVHHAAHDRLYSVIALLDGTTGGIVERVRYNAYGLARQHLPGDVDADGVVGFNDLNFINSHFGGSLSSTSSNYNVHADINADGVVNFSDLGIYLGTVPPPAEGYLSSSGVRNIVGYAGYIHDPAAGPDGGMNLARHRWMDPALGRWATRDPLDYVDGASMLLYAKSSPSRYTDPNGLKCGDCIIDKDRDPRLLVRVPQPDGFRIVPPWAEPDAISRAHEFLSSIENFEKAVKIAELVKSGVSIGTAIANADLNAFAEELALILISQEIDASSPGNAKARVVTKFIDSLSRNGFSVWMQYRAVTCEHCEPGGGAKRRCQEQAGDFVNYSAWNLCAPGGQSLILGTDRLGGREFSRMIRECAQASDARALRARHLDQFDKAKKWDD